MHDRTFDEQLGTYLTDVHAIEVQALEQMRLAPRIAGDASPARFQGAGLRLGAVNLGGFFKAQPDSPVKIAGFAYAVEALEIGAYELLRRTAQRAGDEDTAKLAEQIVQDERQAAERIAGTWDAAVDAALREQVGAR